MEWRTIPGFETYEVSEFGSVRRRVAGGTYPAGYVLTPKPHQRGYRYFILRHNGRDKTMLAHRLVVLAFLGEPPTDEHEVAHNDGDRTNNAATNLRWATPAENQADRKRHGTFHQGEQCGSSKLTADDVQAIRDAYRSGGTPHRRGGAVTMQALADRFCVSVAQISRVVNVQHWRGSATP